MRCILKKIIPGTFPDHTIHRLKGDAFSFVSKNNPGPPDTTLWLGGARCLEQDGSAQCSAQPIWLIGKDVFPIFVCNVAHHLC